MEEDLAEVKSLRTQKITTFLIAVNIIVFFVTELTGSTLNTDVLIKCGALYTPYVAAGQYWRIVTAMFLHSGIRHLLNNMITLGVLGYMLEDELGKVKYVIIYILSGIAGNAAEYISSVRSGGNVVAVGASGAVFGIMGALIWVLIRNRGRIRGISISRLLIMAAFSLYFGFVSSGIANEAHIGGMIAGFVIAMLIYRKKGVR